MCNLFNPFWKCWFPDVIKNSVVCIFYKKWTHCLELNSSLANTGFFKLLEKLTHRTLVSFLEKHEIVSDSQHGFRKGKLTISVLYYYIDSIESTRRSCIQVDRILYHKQKTTCTKSQIYSNIKTAYFSDLSIIIWGVPYHMFKYWVQFSLFCTLTICPVS